MSLSCNNWLNELAIYQQQECLHFFTVFSSRLTSGFFSEKLIQGNNQTTVMYIVEFKMDISPTQPV